jgi:hypothetical protein
LLFLLKALTLKAFAGKKVITPKAFIGGWGLFFREELNIQPEGRRFVWDASCM